MKNLIIVQYYRHKILLSSVKFKLIIQKFGITAFHVRIRARGGNGSNTISSAGHSVMRAIIRSGFKIGKIDDVTPLPTNGTRKKGGRRGRRI
mmetsp:Transcript_11837/g.29183  ORF Transcript_11837/g.29183 Transcript_11837/m.29183 type:complete len:92 (+) Transcript_11837:159-434(+)